MLTRAAKLDVELPYFLIDKTMLTINLKLIVVFCKKTTGFFLMLLLFALMAAGCGRTPVIEDANLQTMKIWVSPEYRAGSDYVEMQVMPPR